MKSVCRAANPETCRYHGSFSFPKTDLNYEEHLKESEKLKLFLSQNEQEALSGYLNQDYMEINAHLYGAGPDSEDTIEKIKALDSALKKYESMSDGEERTTYRATKCYQKFASKEEAAQWFQTNFPEGGKVKLAGFTSTTPNPNALFDFLPPANDDLKKPSGIFKYTDKEWEQVLAKKEDHGLGNIIFVVKSPKGVPVSGYGQTYSEKEQEYLHSRDKEFVVEEVLPYKKVLNPNPDTAWRRETAHATIITLRDAS